MLNLDEIKLELEKLHPKITSLKETLGIDNLKSKIMHLEQISIKSGF